MALETAIADANADDSQMSFLTTPIMRSKLRRIQQIGTNGDPVWQQVAGSTGVGDVLGYPGLVSRQVPGTLTKGSSSDCHAIIFGNWPALIIGEWGVLEILVDPYRLKKQGMVEVTSFLLADVYFLSYNVPDTTARLQISKGVIAPSPTPSQQYMRSYPDVPVLRFKDAIRNQLRRTAAFSLLFLLESTEPAEDIQFRHLLAQLVEQFGNDPHWENFLARAVSSHVDRDYFNAVAMYEKARQSIENDETVRAEPLWQKRVQQIETLENRARDQKPVSRPVMSGYHGS